MIKRHKNASGGVSIEFQPQLAILKPKDRFVELVNRLVERKQPIQCGEDQFIGDLEGSDGMIENLKVHFIGFHQGESNLTQYDSLIKGFVKGLCMSPDTHVL